MSHTPGPWKTVKPAHGHETKNLCVQVGQNENYTTLELLPDDARLMAAAPDLHAVVEGVTSRLGYAEWASPEHAEQILMDLIANWHAAGKAALQKATGQP